MKKALILFTALTLIFLSAGSIYLAERAFHPHRRALTAEMQNTAQKLALSFHCKLQNVEIPALENARLKGWLFEQPTQRPPAILLLHGQADNRFGMIRYASLFLQEGYDVLIPDSRAHGLSGGTVATYGFYEANDVHRWVCWLYTHRNPRVVFGLGESMGAAILLQSLREEPRFAAVIAESPFSTFRQIGIDRGTRLLHTGLPSPFLYTIASTYIEERYGVDEDALSPLEAVKRSKTPVLLIHCMQDGDIPPEHSERIYMERKQGIELWKVPGCGHAAAFGTHRDEFRQHVLQFLGALAVQS